MTSIFVALAAGTLLGYLLRSHRPLFNFAAYVSTASVYALLFLLGLSVGANEAITRNLQQVGLQAFSLSVASLAGSVLFAWALYRLLFRTTQDEE